MLNLTTQTISTLHEGLSAKRFSSREIVQAYLDRMTAVEPSVHAFLEILTEDALAAADVVDAKIASGEPQGTLAGQPLAIKDVLATKGVPTTAASKILAGYRPPYDATAVAKLRGAGAIFLGKTNCDEFAMGGSGENSAYGATHNPWDLTRVPGGSSAGSAAAVAAGEAVAALGTDTGGSVRQPAGFCGVVGLKPTYGRVSRYGLFALASSLDHIGPFARTIEDAAILLNAIAGKDLHDATSVEKPLVDLPTIVAGNIKGMKIGLPKEYFVEGMDPIVEQSIRAAADMLSNLGANVIEVSLPHTEYALAVYYIIQPAETSSNLARYDGIRFGHHATADTLDDLYKETRRQGFGDEVKRRIMLGTYALSAGYHDAYYLKAQKVRTLIRKDFSTVFHMVDALITPTSPGLPFKLGEKFHDPLTMYLADIFTVSANIAGIPGLSLPVEWSNGLPIGGQLLGPLWSEERLLTIGQALERELQFPLRLPTIT